MVFRQKLQYGSLKLLIILLQQGKKCFFVRNNLSSTRLQSEDEASYMASDGDEKYDDEFDDYEEDDGEFDDDEDDNIDSEADEDSLQSNFEQANLRRYS